MRMFALILALCLPGLLQAESHAPQNAETDRVPQSVAEISLSFAPVVQAAAPAVVNIYARRIVPGRASPFLADPFFRDFRNFLDLGPAAPRAENALGSGVILTPSGLLVTNTHVVEDADEIRVVLADRREFAARMVLADGPSDIAILALEGAKDLPTLPFGDSETLDVGDLVLAIGNPFGVGQTVTSGIVSGLARTSAAVGTGQGVFVQTDTAINPGNSGGALVDMQGRLVGVNTAILTRSGGSNGIGFAIPSRLVEVVLEQARDGRSSIERPWPGIAVQPVDWALAEALGLDRPTGVLVQEVHPASTFAPHLTSGDRVVAIAGGPVNSDAELRYRMMIAGTDGPVTVTLATGAETREAKITFAVPPNDDRPTVRITGRGPLSGLEAAHVSPALIATLDLPLSSDGVVITGVAGVARRIGLRPGDFLLSVNDTTIRDLAALEQIATSGPSLWDIVFLREGQRTRLRFRL